MKLSKEARKASKTLFLGSFSDGKLDEAKVRTVVKELADRKPRQYIGILEGYQRYVRLELDKRHVLVESATELERGTRDKLRRAHCNANGSAGEFGGMARVIPTLGNQGEG